MWISRKKFNFIKEQLAENMKALEQAQNYAYLVGIERVGRVNKFVFMRGEEMIEIETMGLISDNLPEWKERLLR